MPDAPLHPPMTDLAVGSNVQPYTTPTTTQDPIYVRTTGNDDTGDGSSSNPYATLHRATQDVGLLNGYDGGDIAIDIGAGTFDLPRMMLNLNNVDITGDKTEDGEYTVTTIQSASNADGTVLDLALTGQSADSLRGKLVQFVGGAADSLYGIVVANDATGDHVASETRVYVTQSGASGIQTGMTSVKVFTLNTVLQLNGGLAEWNTCSGVTITECEFRGNSGNRLWYIQGGAGKIALQRCRFTTSFGRIVPVDAGAVWLTTCYLASSGAGGLAQLERRGLLRLQLGTVLSDENRSDTYIDAEQGTTIEFRGEVVARGLGTNGFYMNGANTVVVGGDSANHALRFDTCKAGFVWNTLDEAMGGGGFLPTLLGYGANPGVRSAYCVTAQDGAVITLGSSSSCPTGDGASYGVGTTNAVSADNGSTAVAEDGSTATLIRGGVPAAVGYATSSSGLPSASTKGDIAVYNGSAWVIQAVGTNGQLLTADSAEADGIKWADAPTELPAASTAGDIAVYNGSAWVIQAVGADGTVLTADSAESDGIKWAAVAAGGSGIPDYQNVLGVDPGGNGDYTTLVAACAAASTGDLIIAAPSTYTLTSTLSIPSGVRVYILPGGEIKPSGSFTTLISLGTDSELAGFFDIHCQTATGDVTRGIDLGLRAKIRDLRFVAGSSSSSTGLELVYNSGSNNAEMHDIVVELSGTYPYFDHFLRHQNQSSYTYVYDCKVRAGTMSTTGYLFGVTGDFWIYGGHCRGLTSISGRSIFWSVGTSGGEMHIHDFDCGTQDADLLEATTNGVTDYGQIWAYNVRGSSNGKNVLTSSNGNNTPTIRLWDCGFEHSDSKISQGSDSLIILEEGPLGVFESTKTNDPLPSWATYVRAILSGAHKIYLPDLANVPIGHRIHVKDTDCNAATGSENITVEVASGSGDNIRSVSATNIAITIASNGGSATLVKASASDWEHLV